MKILKQFRYRKNIINELVESEAAYVNDLETIVENIIIPLKNENRIHKDELKIAFSNI